MSHIPFHPAPNLGDLMDGWSVVPQNPLMPGGDPLVPSIQATAPNQILRKGRLAELMPGRFTVPENPLARSLGMGCGCGGGCGSSNYSLSGLGDTTDPLGFSSGTGSVVDDVINWANSPSPIFTGVSNWVFYGGALIALDLYINHGRGGRGGGKK
jgi:hypothetical protein